jgi:glycosyltransferase involved in cell wall biosynthesis
LFFSSREKLRSHLFKTAKKMMSVTVCITTHNRKEQLNKALLSSFNQTYNNIEIIIVDDFSSDGTEAYLNDSITDSKKKFNYIRNTKNKGLAYSRNTGLKHAKADWIVFLDDDDELTPDSVELKVNEIERNKDLSNLAVVYSGAKNIHTDYNKVFYNSPKINGLIEENIKIGILNTIPSSGLYNKKLLLKFGGFDESLKSFIDHDLWLNMAKHNYIALPINKPLVITYEEKAKKSMVTNTNHRIEGIELFLLKWKDYLDDLLGKNQSNQFIKGYKEKVISKLLIKNIFIGSYNEAKLCNNYLKRQVGFCKSTTLLIVGIIKEIARNIYHNTIK